jgi:hypothetical protein
VAQCKRVLSRQGLKRKLHGKTEIMKGGVKYIGKRPRGKETNKRKGDRK